MYHSTLGLRVIKKKRGCCLDGQGGGFAQALFEGGLLSLQHCLPFLRCKKRCLRLPPAVTVLFAVVTVLFAVVTVLFAVVTVLFAPDSQRRARKLAFSASSTANPKPSACQRLSESGRDFLIYTG